MKNKMHHQLNTFLTLIICGSLFSSCSNHNQKGESSEKFINKESQEDISIRSLNLDSIFLNIPENSSGIGCFSKQKDSIYFFDEIAYQVYAYDKVGRFHGLKLNNGFGPNEVPRFQNYVSANNKHLFFDGMTIYIYNTSWVREREFVLEFDIKESHNALLNSPKPEYQGIYEVKYFQNQLTELAPNQLIFNIETTHINYNAFLTKDYYTSSRTMAQLDLISGKVVKIFGRKSPKYLDYHFIPHFDYAHYHYVNETFYVNHEPDELIYAYDKDFNPLFTFGRPGVGMNTNYKQTNTLDAANDGDLFFSDRTKFGYYSNIFYSKENDILFRCYTLGTTKEGSESNISMRLQIYRGTTLIGDVEVPPKFKILDYDAPYYYAQGLEDETNNKLGFFRFKL